MTTEETDIATSDMREGLKTLAVYGRRGLNPGGYRPGQDNRRWSGPFALLNRGQFGQYCGK